MKTTLLAASFAVMAAAGAPTPEHRLEAELNDMHEICLRSAEHSAQGLAIHDGTVFALYHLGHCVVYDLDGNAFLGEFTLDGAEGTHCNNASFGTEHAEGNERFPLLYVSECGGQRRCFVLDIDTHGSRHVQTIRFEGTGIVSFCDWCADRENGYLYAVGKTPESGVVLKRFRLPALAEGIESEGGEGGEGESGKGGGNGIRTVVLGDEDVLAEHSYPAGFFHIMQGTYIRDGKMYCPTGHPRAGSCYIHVLDMESGERTALYNIDDIPYEPEGVCAAAGRLFVFFGGGNGRVYSFAL